MSDSGTRRSASVPGPGVAPVSNASAGAAEGSSSSATDDNGQSMRTLSDVMRAPSSTLPDVVVLQSVPDSTGRKEVLDPKEDLWLTTADGRYNCPIIPLHVGEPPDTATFYVHRDILIKHEYFRMALCGPYLESNSQSLTFPHDDPGTFHFLVAYVYEGRYDPLKPIASVLVPDANKGKGKDGSGSPLDDSSGDDDSSTSFGSDVSARSRRRGERRRRRADQHFERMRQKHPGSHRPNCGCPTCRASGGPPCWACAAPRAPPPPQPAPPPRGVAMLDRNGVPQPPPNRRGMRPGPGRPRNYPHAPFQGPPPPPPPPPAGGWRIPEARILGEDLRTWLLAYELNIDVYIMANKYLMEGFKREVAKATIDMLETAGADAAVPQVLQLCSKLRHGLPESDPLLKMVFARIGFLQSLLWRKEPESTADFLHENPEVAAIILRETIVRREEEYSGGTLPSMEPPWSTPYEFRGGGPGTGYRGPPPYGNYPGRPRW